MDVAGTSQAQADNLVWISLPEGKEGTLTYKLSVVDSEVKKLARRVLSQFAFVLVAVASTVAFSVNAPVLACTLAACAIALKVLFAEPRPYEGQLKVKKFVKGHEQFKLDATRGELIKYNGQPIPRKEVEGFLEKLGLEFENKGFRREALHLMTDQAGHGATGDFLTDWQRKTSLLSGRTLGSDKNGLQVTINCNDEGELEVSQFFTLLIRDEQDVEGPVLAKYLAESKFTANLK